MNHYERIKATLQQHPVDRVPVNLWAHMPEVDQNPKLLARKQIEFAKKIRLRFHQTNAIRAVWCRRLWSRS